MIAAFRRLRDAWIATPGTVRGILLVLTATFSAATSNALVHFVTEEIHAFEVVFFRCLFALLFLGPTLFKAGLGSMKTARIGLHMGRAAIQTASMLLGFLGLALTPLAKATSLQFTAPLFATVLAVIILGEVIRVRRVVALLAGFSGALVVLQPWQGTYDLGALASVASAACFAVVMIMVRKLGTTDTPTTQLIYLALFSTPITFAFAVTVWQTPTLLQLALMAGIGLFTTFNNLCLAHALRLAELSAVVPVQFSKLIWAAAIGYFIFAEIPDVWTWTGGSLIFASVIYITIRERGERKAAVPPAAPSGS